MFKIESYVTPLILSYVDKYIKNIKPEDSQVCKKCILIFFNLSKHSFLYSTI